MTTLCPSLLTFWKETKRGSECILITNGFELHIRSPFLSNSIHIIHRRAVMALKGLEKVLF